MKTSEVYETSKLLQLGLSFSLQVFLAACSFGGLIIWKNEAMFILQIQIRWITLCPIRATNEIMANVVDGLPGK